MPPDYAVLILLLMKLYAEKFPGTMFSLHGHALTLAAL